MAFRRISKGDRILADDINAIYEALSRIVVKVSPPLQIQGGVLSVGQQGQGMWIKLTSQSGNNYAWTEQIPQTGGGWTNGTASGTTSTDQAMEINGNTSIGTLPVKVRAWRAPESKQVLFQANSC